MRKTLWLTYDTEDDTVLATLFNGGTISDGDGWVRFDDIEETKPTQVDIQKIAQLFQQQLSTPQK